MGASSDHEKVSAAVEILNDAGFTRGQSIVEGGPYAEFFEDEIAFSTGDTVNARQILADATVRIDSADTSTIYSSKPSQWEWPHTWEIELAAIAAGANAGRSVAHESPKSRGVPRSTTHDRADIGRMMLQVQQIKEYAVADPETAEAYLHEVWHNWESEGLSGGRLQKLMAVAVGSVLAGESEENLVYYQALQRRGFNSRRYNRSRDSNGG